MADTNYQLKLLELSWSNVQHNERLRNHLFSLYLVISGVLFAFIGGGKASSNALFMSAEVVAISLGFFVWFVGTLFVWAYIRFSQMIGRDTRVIRAILSEIQSVEQSTALKVMDTYYENIDRRKILSFGSVNTCLTLTTLVISISAQVFSFWNIYQLTPELPVSWLNLSKFPYLIVITILSIWLNLYLKNTFEKRWGRGK